MKRSLLLFAAIGGLIACHPTAAGAGLTLAPLPYPFAALEPHIDAQTMEIHYTRHHQTYFDNLVKAIADTPLATESVEVIVAGAGAHSATVRNNAGGHYNHTLFWQVMSPDGGGKPVGELAAAIDAAFGSFEKFRELFNQAALSRFGSGWAWLAVDKAGKLFVASSANQDNPLMDIADRRGTPILGLDVWEHAYYLKYQNRRGSYIEAFWHVINWPEVTRRYQAASGKL